MVVDRETVWIAMKSLGPEGVSARSRHKLQRRLYNAREPNYVWHIDGYDKIKPYGFAIHGSIDGYSREILWLKVLAINDNPKNDWNIVFELRLSIKDYTKAGRIQ